MTMSTMSSMSKDSNNPRSLLAPGFRFHPTDEELVSYYLKRKLTGRSLRVDAIADVDVYGREPWDLPAMSRLRSRDMEWYFFSTLDRKYSNRSRTNRATKEGYWKTTGKDRAVLHRSVVVGMKKTLVFHVGRAPKGQRTNWVMHEYRRHRPNQEEGAGGSSGEDGFVVCRIFQKAGSGPQNGAQYGAPYVEEEWEEDDEDDGHFCLEAPPKGNELVAAVAPNGYVQLNDLVPNQDVVNQHEIPKLFPADADGQDIGINSEDQAKLLGDIFDVGTYLNDQESQDNPNLMYLEGNTGLCDQSQSPNQNDGYLELKDILCNGDMVCPSNEGASEAPKDIINDNISAHRVNESLTAQEVDEILLHGVNETLASQELDDNAFFENLDISVNPHDLRQMGLSAEGDCNLHADGPLNLAAGDYNSQFSENMFYDAPGQDIYADDIFMDQNQVEFSPVVTAFDDLMAMFEADNNLQNIPDSSESMEFGSSSPLKSNSAAEVKYDSRTSSKVTPQVLGVIAEGAESSSSIPADEQNKFYKGNDSVLAASDARGAGSWNKSLKRHVVNILGSINAPPAMAEDCGKQIQLISSTRSSTSVRVSAGMIQVHETVMGSALQKNSDMGFFLSYGVADNDVVSKSICFETKMQGGAMSMMFRGGLYLFGIYMLILATSLKVGMCIYSK